MTESTLHDRPSGKGVPVSGVPRPRLSWEEFEARLAASLARMALDQYLILSTRPARKGATTYYVQFAQGGRAGFRAEAVSNSFLSGPERLSPAQEDAMGELGWQFPDPGATRDPNFSRQWPMPVPFADIAHLAVRTLREVHGVARPADLLYRRFSRDGEAFAEPSLGIRAERPRKRGPKAQPAAPVADPLSALVEAALSRFLAVDHITLDPTGNYRVPTGTTTLLVRVIRLEPPVLRVFSPAFHGIAPTPQLLTALNELNSELLYCRALVTNGDVIIATELRSDGITADDVEWACRPAGWRGRPPVRCPGPHCDRLAPCAISASSSLARSGATGAAGPRSGSWSPSRL